MLILTCSSTASASPTMFRRRFALDVLDGYVKLDQVAVALEVAHQAVFNQLAPDVAMRST
jgi:hypothetical protein